MVRERIVEVPFVFQNLDLPKGSNILDLGCCESELSIQLASLGYKVIGVDWRDYKLTHPNFSFVRCDFVNNEFKGGLFDAVVAVSTIEHCGLGHYREPRFSDGDHRVINQVYRVLKKGGRFIMTVPFGRKGQTPWYRVYDGDSLNSLLSKFEIIRQGFFFAPDREYWILVEKEQLNDIDCVSKGFAEGIACTLAKKVKQGVKND